MKNADREEFAALLTATFEVYNTRLSPQAISIWWSALERFSLAQVRAGLSAHVTDSDRGRFSPKPADVIGGISLNDGRLGADEAWSLCPQDEKTTVVWTDEIKQAYFDGAHVLVDDDPVAARMGFKAAYQRIVAQSRALGRAPQVEVSLGHDLQGREPAIRQAMERGLLPTPMALKYLHNDPGEIVGIEESKNAGLIEERS